MVCGSCGSRSFRGGEAALRAFKTTCCTILLIRRRKRRSVYCASIDTRGEKLSQSVWQHVGLRRAARSGVPLLLLCALSACGGGGGQRSYSGGGSYRYTAPGPPGDPWGPYISEAAQRFNVPERWIREVMRQESGGHAYLNGQPITSDAGATGLMQVMPATYAELRVQYNLGDDPYNPHDNIMAGTAYIREMYDKYGSPAFLAAYNAGPQRVDDYLAGRSNLPNETVNYLASIAPRLGTEVAMSGPLAAYAQSGASYAPDPVPHPYATAPIAGCWRDPDAAYDPDAPCRAAPPPVQVAQAAPPLPRAAQDARCWHDPNAAYDPEAPCQTPPPAPVQVAAAAPQPQAQPVSGAACWHDPNAAYDPDAPCQAPPAVATVPPPMPANGAPPSAPMQVADASVPGGSTAPGRVLWGNGTAAVRRAPSAAPPHHNFTSYLIPQAAAAELPPPRASGAWAIQVGAFANADLARSIAAGAKSFAPQALSGARTLVGVTAPFGGHVLYRARLAGLSAQEASNACSLLAAQHQACVTVPPGG
jgi:D-alanyl-D-alanine carboxypeptidase